MIDSSYLSSSERQTLAEDVSCREEILSRSVTVFIRPGDRTQPEHPTYWQTDDSGSSYIGFILKYGSHEEKKPPIFHKEKIPVVIERRVAKKLREITPEELGGAYQNINTPKAVLDMLARKYPKEVLDKGSMVTIYKVRYN